MGDHPRRTNHTRHLVTLTKNSKVDPVNTLLPFQTDPTSQRYILISSCHLQLDFVLVTIKAFLCVKLHSLSREELKLADTCNARHTSSSLLTAF